MSSLDRLDTRTTGGSETDASPSSARRRAPRTEDDRLRRELRRWRDAIDGVMDETSELATPETPEIRLHSPAQDETTKPAVAPPPVLNAPRPTSLGDALALDDSPEAARSSESLQEFIERTDSSPTRSPRSPSRGPFVSTGWVNGTDEPSSGSRSRKDDRVSVVGISSPTSVTAPSTPRPTARTGRTAELRALEALDDPDLVDAKARDLARQVWEGDESFIESRKAAEWLGSATRLSTATLRHYMGKFDFAGLRLDGAFRRLCSRLYLKAETQQVDRILEQFSLRYYEQNPQYPFGSSDVVHAVTYSILLLNTDLHVVDSASRMTRQQFIRNTLEAVRAQADTAEAATTPGLLFGADKVSAEPPALAADASPGLASDGKVATSRVSLDQTSRHRKAVVDRPAEDSPSSSSLNLPVSPSMSRSATTASARAFESPARASLRSESALTLNSTISHRSIEASLPGVLKDMYNAIKAHPIYQLAGDSGSGLNLPEGGHAALSLVPSSSPYATWSPNLQRRTSHRSSRSTISGVAPSNAHKRASIRGLGALLGANSLELVRSTSPTPSTATSMSEEHWGLASGAAAMLQQGATNTIGFASNLAHSIIKEQQEDDARSEASLVEVTDEELALLGAPWAKEGLLERKHFWETAGKRAKDKAWVQAFVVVSAGQLRMFRFGSGGGGGGGGPGPGSGRAIGGGDWTTTASDLGSLSLVHALTSALPPPGYSRSRPHCFIFTLPDGGSFVFQAGTPDLVAEWVATCNYWSARLSREPLAGGVSNMEYGWNGVDEFRSLESDDRAERASIRSGHSRRSFASSAFRHHYAALPLTDRDRVHIHDWMPPQTPLAPSQLMEDDQLEALERHLGVLRKEVAHHDALKVPMTRLYSPRSSNAAKALSNWTRKAQHLEAERVKYQTYVEALASAVQLRTLHNGKKEVERMLAHADEADDAPGRGGPGGTRVRSRSSSPMAAVPPAVPDKDEVSTVPSSSPHQQC
ncbi:hypothetical protein JCM3774_002300 [Rhodotorula dairenensis]